jgi:hypothetical protein
MGWDGEDRAREQQCLRTRREVDGHTLLEFGHDCYGSNVLQSGRRQSKAVAAAVTFPVGINTWDPGRQADKSGRASRRGGERAKIGNATVACHADFMHFDNGNAVADYIARQSFTDQQRCLSAFPMAPGPAIGGRL